MSPSEENKHGQRCAAENWGFPSDPCFLLSLPFGEQKQEKGTYKKDVNYI